MPPCVCLFRSVSVLFVALIGVVGCQPTEQVESYVVPRTRPPREVLDAAAYQQQLDQILVAIVPQGNQAWFFKLGGKAAEIEPQRTAFEDFLATVTLASSPTVTPSWEVPAGWTEQPATGLRLATLLLDGQAEPPLALAVSKLPWTGSWDEFLVANVNRWLGQLQCQPLPADTVLQLAQQSPFRGGSATVFQLAGSLRQPPRPSRSQLTSQPADQTTRQAAELSYQAPSGWLPGRLSSVRKAAFLLPAGGPTDEVAVTSFPLAAGAQMGNLLANVQRWAGQVGQEPPTAQTLEELVEEITVADLAASYVELVSPAEAAEQRALLVAVVKRQGMIWFFKMVGQRALVLGQRQAFREFLASVKFSPASD